MFVLIASFNPLIKLFISYSLLEIIFRFKEGDIVMSSRNGEKGTIHRVGGNYAIVITEDGEMFREWIKNIRTINNTRRTLP